MKENIIFFTQADLTSEKLSGGTRRYLELMNGFNKLSKDLKVTSLGVVPLNVGYLEHIVLHKSKNPILFILKNWKTLNKYREHKVICFEFYSSLPLILLGFRKVVTFIRQNYILCKVLELKSIQTKWNLKNRIKIFYLTKLEDFVLAFSLLVVTQNQSDRDVLVKRNNSIKSKTLVIPNNINPSWLEGKSICIKQSSKFRIGFAGKITDPRKGGDLLLSAFKKLNLNNSRLIIAGDNSELEGEKIVNMGYQKDILDFLSSIDLLVVPSLTDSFPNIIVEAIKYEIPVIGSKVGGIPELLKHSALLFETNETSLLEKLSFFNSKENLSWARSLILERKKELTFDWPKKVYEIISI